MGLAGKLWFLACLLRGQMSYRGRAAFLEKLPLRVGVDCSFLILSDHLQSRLCWRLWVLVFTVPPVHPHPNPEVQPVLPKSVATCNITCLRACSPESLINCNGEIVEKSEKYFVVMEFPSLPHKSVKSSCCGLLRKARSLWFSQQPSKVVCLSLQVVFTRSCRKPATLMMSEIWEEIMLYHLPAYFAA